MPPDHFEQPRAEGDCPYVGVRAYEESDRHLFLGREQEIELVMNKTLAERLTILFAASGIGKSSLLRAGVIPRLRGLCPNLEVHYRDDWIDGNRVEELRDIVTRFDESAVRHGEEEDPPLLLLVLDGFEQLLTRSSFGQSSELVTFLAELSYSSRNVRIVICLRAEFLARLDGFRDIFPGFMKGRFHLPPISRAEAARALVEPARQRGVEWAPELVEALLDDFSPDGEQDELGESRPQLSFLFQVAQRLWQRLPSGTPRIGMGLYQGHDQELQGILDDVWSGLDQANLDAAARIVCRLAPPTGRKAPCTLTELVSEPELSQGAVRAVLEHLQRHRLVRLREQGNVQWYELVHDSLTHFLRRWGEQHMVQTSQRVAKLSRQRRNRARRIRLFCRATAWAAALACVGWLGWSWSEGLRVANADRRALRQLGSARDEREQTRLIEERAKAIWTRSSHASRAKWAVRWLEAADLVPRVAARPAGEGMAGGSERMRAVGDERERECDVYISPDDGYLAATLDAVWRRALPAFRRVQIPMSGQPHICIARHYGPGTVGLQRGDPLTATVALSARVKEPQAAESETPRGEPYASTKLDGGVPRSSVRPDEVEGSALIRPLRPELGWRSVMVDVAELHDEGLDELVARCASPVAQRPESWPEGACQLPNWSSTLLELAGVQHSSTEEFLKSELMKMLRKTPWEATRSASFKELLRLTHGERDSRSDRVCMEHLLRGLSLRALKEGRVMPALRSLLPQVAQACEPRAGARSDDATDELWASLSLPPSSSHEGGSPRLCAGRESAAAALEGARAQPLEDDAIEPERLLERALPTMSRVAILPRVQVNLGSALGRCESGQRSCLFDDSGRRTEALTSSLDELKRRLHEQDGIVLPPVQFAKDGDTPTRAVEVLSHGACISRPQPLQHARADEELPAWIAHQVQAAVQSERPSYFEKRDVQDAVAPLGARAQRALSSLDDGKLTGFMRAAAASPDASVRRLLARASPLVGLLPLFEALDPSSERWQSYLVELAHPSQTALAAQVERAASAMLLALRKDEPEVAVRLLRSSRVPATTLVLALARAYPQHASLSLLELAERSCSWGRTTEQPTLGLRTLAQLMDWAVEAAPRGLEQLPSRTASAQLCVLHRWGRKNHGFAPPAETQWRAAQRLLLALADSDATQEHASAALAVLAHGESSAPEPLEQASAQKLLSLLLRKDGGEHSSTAQTLSKEPMLKWRVHTALGILEGSSRFGPLQRALSWALLEGSEDPQIAGAVLRALERPIPSHAGEADFRTFAIALAQLHLEHIADASKLLDQLAQRAEPAWLMPLARSVKMRAMLHQKRFHEVIEQASARRSAPQGDAERCRAWADQLSSSFALGAPNLPLLQEEVCHGDSLAMRLFVRAWAGLALGSEEAERDASAFIMTGDPYADYARILLAWRRAQSDDEHGRALVIAERWDELQRVGARNAWPARIRRGDTQVWREMLIAHWAGELPAEELLSPLESEASLRASELNELGLTLSSLRAEGYFYVALKASAEGDTPRARALWERVERQGRPEYVEYALASYFLKHASASASTATTMASAGGQSRRHLRPR